MPPPPEVCPHCGAFVPRRARACPECGADETTGWSERAAGQRLDLPEDEFDYEEFAQREFGTPRKVARPPIGWLWWAVAVLLVLGFLLGVIL